MVYPAWLVMQMLVLGNAAANLPLNDWPEASSDAESLLNTFSLSQLINITIGNNVIGFTQSPYIDGPNGVNGPLGVSGWTTAQTLASSFDTQIIKEQYEAIAIEFKKKGYAQTLGPVTGPLGRSVLSGRLFEGFGQDPYLNGNLFAAAVNAIQSQGVQATGKHYFDLDVYKFAPLGNEQETNRTERLSVDRSSSNIDDRTAHELYLWPWVDAVEAGIACIMCVMNRVNDTQACENSHLLNDLLKGELNYPGWVIPDATAVVNITAAYLNGLDTPNTANLATILAQVQNGTIPESIIKNQVRRVIAAQLNINPPIDQFPSLTSVKNTIIRDSSTPELIRKNGAASIVLLKNVNNALPLRNPQYVSIFGKDAGNINEGPSPVEDVFNFQGDTYFSHLASGGGSGRTYNPYIVSPLDALTQRSNEGPGPSFDIKYVLSDNYTYIAASSNFGASWSVASNAAAADVSLVFLNAFSKEGADREALFDPVGDTLVNEVASYCNNTMVVINGCGARIVDAWIEHPNVTAVLNAGLLGEQSGNSIMDVIFGDVNPSARLPYTIAKQPSDYNGAICPCCECNYTEGLYIDYRHFDQADITPRYEFGYGLSYTSFDYSNFQVELQTQTPLATVACGHAVLGGVSSLFDTVVTASMTVTNTGNLNGNEVVQLYVEFPAAANSPVMQLRGFDRIYLTRGASTTVRFQLQRRDLSIWDVVSQSWKLVPGTYMVHFGKSSRIIEGMVPLTLSLT